MAAKLQITIHKAQDLEDVERFGKNDPYARIALDAAVDADFQRTKTIPNAGKNVSWEETITIANFNPQTQHTLFVEVLDRERHDDDLIAFTGIPLQQVLSAPDQAFRGRFDLFKHIGSKKGEIILSIVVIPAGKTEAPLPGNEKHGQAQFYSAHHERLKVVFPKQYVPNDELLKLINAQPAHVREV
ncbi:hypothetical protein EC957_002999 [Mortierella hygrophila]|uniref:C2 domain-containing protein n=1 Tax=Mortierella hygrophila TaxID=979708 RepID=A0A9P6F3F5_9FUNG|nr:hypothetical protein EC957_002999 [Mortierella hygrophila]